MVSTAHPHLFRLVGLLLLLFGVGGQGRLNAQEPTPTLLPNITYAYRIASMFAGPGETHEHLGWLNPGVRVEIVERNRTGNWLHVVQPDAAIDGWVMTGFLTLSADTRFSAVPVNEELPDALPERVPMEPLAQLYEAPVIPEISDAMREVYERGLELGNHSNIVTKVGDSLSADPLYLSPMSQNDYVLGPYDYLEDSIRFFGASTAGDSVAARVGMTSYVIFDPMWARGEACEPNETPLACEYRVTKPSIALIMFGPNDVRHITVETFEANMRRVVEETLDAGIIPVLSTFTTHPQEPFYWPAIDFNLALKRIADEHEIPLLNFWSAARFLPEYGLDQDLVHLTHSGFRYLKYDTGHESWYGLSLWNLLSIRVLDELRRELEMDKPPVEATEAATEAVG